MITLVAMFFMVGCGAKDDDYSEKSDKTKYSKTVTDPVNDKSENEQKLNVKKHDSDINTDISEPIDDNTSEKPSDDISDDTDSSKPSVPEKSKTNTADISKSKYVDLYDTFVKYYNSEINLYSYETIALLIKMGAVASTYDVFDGEYIPDSEIEPLIINAGYEGDINDFINTHDGHIAGASYYYNYFIIRPEPNLASVLNTEFDADYYATQYPEDAAFCAKYDLSLEKYFSVYGAFTGQSMSADFDLETYKTNRPELVDAFGDCNINYYIYYLENIETEKDLANPNK